MISPGPNVSAGEAAPPSYDGPPPSYEGVPPPQPAPAGEGEWEEIPPELLAEVSPEETVRQQQALALQRLQEQQQEEAAALRQQLLQQQEQELLIQQQQEAALLQQQQLAFGQQQADQEAQQQAEQEALERSMLEQQELAMRRQAEEQALLEREAQELEAARLASLSLESPIVAEAPLPLPLPDEPIVAEAPIPLPFEPPPPVFDAAPEAYFVVPPEDRPPVVPPEVQQTRAPPPARGAPPPARGAPPPARKAPPPARALVMGQGNAPFDPSFRGGLASSRASNAFSVDHVMIHRLLFTISFPTALQYLATVCDAPFRSTLHRPSVERLSALLGGQQRVEWDAVPFDLKDQVPNLLKTWVTASDYRFGQDRNSDMNMALVCRAIISTGKYYKTFESMCIAFTALNDLGGVYHSNFAVSG